QSFSRGIAITPCFYSVFPTNKPEFLRPSHALTMRSGAVGFQENARGRCQNRLTPGTQIHAASLDSRITYPSRRIPMRSKLAISALVVASLFGATAIASAQMQPAPGASSEGNVGPGATAGTKMKSHKMKSHKMRT